jgi:hypothetical protein
VTEILATKENGGRDSPTFTNPELTAGFGANLGPTKNARRKFVHIF